MHRRDSTVELVEFEALRLSTRSGAEIKHLKQKETFWLHALRVAYRQSLNEDCDLLNHYSPGQE